MGGLVATTATTCACRTQILKGLSEGYRKIRNTLRYALSQPLRLRPGEGRGEARGAAAAGPRGRGRGWRSWWRKVRKAYEDYEFHLVYRDGGGLLRDGPVGACTSTS